ncbi:MAG: PepSY-like domain-containing protein [Muribaculaceae bacterium]|nr:PepSY-like domain-containing protein [Muribaculaceae bacterium]
MKPLSIILIAITAMLAPACSDSDVWDSVPPKIATFLNRYYPNSELASCTRTGSDYRVRIKDGPGITFDAACEWTAIAGYGELIPQVLLFDQLPPALYEYLQQTATTADVYSLERDRTTYTVGLKNTSVVYDIATGTVRSPVPPD